MPSVICSSKKQVNSCMSKKQIFSFGKLPTLSTTTWSCEKLKQSWKWSDRSMETVMQRFVELNQKNLSYLGISSCVESVNGKPGIKLTTSKYIGSIPIISPMNGKPVGDLIVTGRFGENAGELIKLLDDSIKLEYSDELQLVQHSQMTPPIFIECCKFLETYEQAEKFKWRKFTNEIKTSHQPNSSTLWIEYALRNACNPNEFSVFLNKSNSLTTEHLEWQQLNHVLQLAIGELESKRTPIRTRSIYSSQVDRMKIKLRNKCCCPIDKIKIHISDPHIIKQLKQLANSILNNHTNERLAWRMDYAEFFERYVQYLLCDISKKKGARQINNPHYSIGITNRPPWALNYLEPDIIIQKLDEQVVVDAKYKSHLFNWYNDTEELKMVFRHDLHQLLAYCSFNSMHSKQALLVYPFSNFTCHKMNVNSPLSTTEAQVFLIGIPLERNRIEEVKSKLNEIIIFNDPKI